MRVSAALLALIAAASLARAAGNDPASADRGDDFAAWRAGTVSWATPGTGEERTVIAGSLQTPEGAWPIRWTLSRGEARLSILVPAGGAERPPMELRLRPLPFRDGTSLLLQDFPPQANSGDPFRVVPVARARTAELFAPIGVPEGLRLSPQSLPEAAGRALRLPRVRAMFHDMLGAAPEEGPFVPFLDPADRYHGMAFIFRKVRGRVGDINVDYLKYATKTKKIGDLVKRGKPR